MAFAWQAAIVPNPLTLPVQARVTEALECFTANRSHPHRSSCVLILEQDQVVGMLSPQDVMQWVAQYFSNPDQDVSVQKISDQINVAQIMTPPLTIAARDVTLENLKSLFQHRSETGILITEKIIEKITEEISKKTLQQTYRTIANTPSFTETSTETSTEISINLNPIALNTIHLITLQSLLQSLDPEEGATPSPPETLATPSEPSVSINSELANLFQTTFDQAAVGIAHVSPTGQFIQINQRFCEITGYDREEMMGLTFQEITYPDDLNIDLDYVNQLLAGTLPTYAMEKRYIRKDGSLTWIHLTVALVRETNGDPQYFISVIQEINDRKKLENDRYNASLTLAKYQSLYEDLISNISEAIFVTDETGEFVFISSDSSHIFGYSSLELLSQRNIVNVLGNDFVNLELLKVRGEILNQECEIYDRDGKTHYLLVNIKSVDLNPGKILYICRDITDRKQAEDELHLYEQIISTTDDLMAFIDCNYQYHLANDAYLRRSGRSKAETVGKTPADLMGTEVFEQVIKPKLDRCFAGESVNYQDWFLFADQQCHYLDVVYTPYRESSGIITGAVISIRDITSTHQAKQMLALQARRAEVLLSLPVAADTLPEQEFLQYSQELIEELTESTIAFIHFVSNDQQSIELVAWSRQTLEESCRASFDTPYPVIHAGIWADALRENRPVVVNNYEQYPDKQGLPEGHVPIKRFISVPVIDNGKVVMLTGVGNKDSDYTDLDVETVQLLSNEIWRIAQGKRTLAQLQDLNRELEQRVEERAERLHLATQAARLGIWDWDVVNDRLRWDDRMYELYGERPGDERAVKDWAARLHPEDAERVHTLVEKALAGEQDFQTTFRILQPSGKIAWIETHSLIKRDNAGRPLRMIGINIDVSDRKQVEEQIQQESIFRQQILDNMAEGLCVCTIQPQFPAFRFSLWNPQMENITGYTLAEINNINWSKILASYPEVRHHFIKTITDIRQGNHTGIQEWEIVRKNGQKCMVSISISTIPSQGNSFLILGIIQDISDRKQAELELKNTQAKFQRLVDDIGHNFMVFSYSTTNKALTYVSSGIRSIFGLFRQDVLDKDWGEVIQWLPPCLERWEQQVQTFREHHSPFQQFEMDFIHTDGHYRTVQISQHPVFDRSDELIAIEGVLEDVTQQRQYKAMLQQTNKELERATRLKDEFLASMSHELRTPLNSILGMSEVLLEGILGEVNDKQRHSLETIQRSGNHLLELINDILDLSKIEAGKLELNCDSTNIETLCSSSLAFIRQQALNKQIQLTTTIAPHLPPVLLDERRIRQVLVNLLSNAVKFGYQLKAKTPTQSRSQPARVSADLPVHFIPPYVGSLKFTPKGGSIHLDVFCHQPPEHPEHPEHPEQNFLRLAVTDTGIGISPEDQRKLFQPFVQIDGALNRQYSGTGLGLSLVKRIVQLHQGSVGVQSELGSGSCFWIDLPCQFDTRPPEGVVLAIPQTTSTLPNYPACPTHPPLILLAEDNEANVQTLQNYLGAKGYELITASNGEEAIEKAKLTEPDLILMDIQMPTMDGLEAIRQLRAMDQFQQTPIIALTALAMKGDDDRCLEAGANAYVTKPVRLKQLLGTIQNLLQLSPVQQQN